MFKDIFNDIWLNYRGRFLCTLTGFVIAALFLLLGFWQTLFLLLFVAGGFFIGYKIDQKRRSGGVAGPASAAGLS